LLVLCIFIGFVYFLLIVGHVNAWNNMEEIDIPNNYQPITNISVIIPARNEADNIRACIDSILAQNYSNFELIVVNDHSSDSTQSILNSYKSDKLKAIDLSERHSGELGEEYADLKGKKRALSTGISTSVHKLIVCSDADCEYRPDWLATLASAYEIAGARMIAAPVVYHKESGFLQHFQSLDFMGMLIFGAGGLRMKLGTFANGANLSFERSLFDELGGYSGNEEYASGDDVFLMEKALKLDQEKVLFLRNKQAIVKTLPVEGWRAFLQQRIRWGSKTKASGNTAMKGIAAYVFVYNVMILGGAIYTFFNTNFALCFLMLFLWKFCADLFLLFRATSYFERRNLLWLFLAAEPLHVIYIVWAGLLASVGNYKWKDRNLR